MNEEVLSERQLNYYESLAQRIKREYASGVDEHGVVYLPAQELLALVEEVRRGRRDTERLDWLEEMREKGKVHWWSGRGKRWIELSLEYARAEHAKTVREGIDLAQNFEGEDPSTGSGQASSEQGDEEFQRTTDEGQLTKPEV